MLVLRTLTAVLGLSLLAIAPAEAKKLKTPKSENANVQSATKKSKKYKPTKYKAPKLSKKPGKSSKAKYGLKSTKKAK